MQADGKVLIGGGFTSINAVARSHIARLNASGGVDNSFNPTSGPDRPVINKFPVQALGLQLDGRLIIGGYFTSVAGLPRNNIARLLGDEVNPSPRLGNISTRLRVGTGDNVLIAGFIINGTVPKRELVRASGPSLIPAGIANPLANPQLDLNDSTDVIARNDNWQTTQIGGVITADQVSEIQGSNLAPGNAAEPAMIVTLPPGSYTAIVQGVSAGTGARPWRCTMSVPPWSRAWPTLGRAHLFRRRTT